MTKNKLSLSSSPTKMTKTKLSVRNQTRFKNAFLDLRAKTILRKASELSILCDNKICVLHYDRDGNLVDTMPQDQSQVRDVLHKYSNLSDGERIKKSINLSQFYNKKLADEKKRSLTDAEERERFTKKVEEFKGSLKDQFHKIQDLVRDLSSSQDHHQTTTEQDLNPNLDVISQKDHNFPEASSSYGFFPHDDFTCSLIEEDPLMMNFCPPVIDDDPVYDHQQQIGSLTNNLLMSGDASTSTTDQDLSPAVYNSNHQSKFSMFLYNHETATFTQLPNSVSSKSFDQGLTPPYINDLNGAQGGFNFVYDNNLNEAQGGFNFGCSNSLNTQGFDFGCNTNLCT